jgi:hypothetical protein
VPPDPFPTAARHSPDVPVTVSSGNDHENARDMGSYSEAWHFDMRRTEAQLASLGDSRLRDH